MVYQDPLIVSELLYILCAMSRVLGHLVEPERGLTKLFRSSSFILIFPKILYSVFGHNIIHCLIKALKK